MEAKDSYQKFLSLEENSGLSGHSVNPNLLFGQGFPL